MMMIKYFLSFFLFISVGFSQGSVLLVGGGSENYSDWSDIPYKWMVDRAPNKKILILHYSTVSAFLPDYFKSLGAVQAVSNAITSSTANDSSIFKMILEFDGIFLRGGDQWEYVQQWNGTLTEQAITAVFQRGGVIGGTSAGAMVLSKIIADAKTTSVAPRTSIRSPLNSGITFTQDFLGFVPDILCDTHFYERGRIGRLLSMLAVYHHQNGKWITGIGIDDATALGVSANGTAEVFGSGVVSLLMPKLQTTAVVRPAEPLGLSSVFVRQLTKGTTFQLQTGSILTSPNGNSYHPMPFSSHQKSIVMDGGNSVTEWIGPNGSLQKFLAIAGTDTIGIITGSPMHSQVISLRTRLDSLKVASSLLIAAPSVRNIPSQGSVFSRFSSFILMNLPPDSLLYLTDSSSITGNAFRILSDKTFLLLGDAAAFAGDAFVNNLEITTTAAYRGRLTIENGLALTKGMMVLPRLYESDTYIENRACGLLWGIGKSQPSYGLFLDNSSHGVIQNGTLTMFGASPGLLIDLRSTSITAFPTYVASGGIGPRQNSALNSAEISVIQDSASFKLTTPLSVSDKKISTVPEVHQLLNNYPNPFNPSTTIEFVVTGNEFISLTVSDILGRTMESLAKGMFSPGRHRVEFKGENHSSGIYLITLNAGGQIIMKKAVLIK